MVQLNIIKHVIKLMFENSDQLQHKFQSRRQSTHFQLIMRIVKGIILDEAESKNGL